MSAYSDAVFGLFNRPPRNPGYAEAEARFSDPRYWIGKFGGESYGGGLDAQGRYEHPLRPPEMPQWRKDQITGMSPMLGAGTVGYRGDLEQWRQFPDTKPGAFGQAISALLGPGLDLAGLSGVGRAVGAPIKALQRGMFPDQAGALYGGGRASRLPYMYHGTHPDAAKAIEREGFEPAAHSELGHSSVSFSHDPSVSYRFGRGMLRVPTAYFGRQRNMSPFEYDFEEGRGLGGEETVRLPNLTLYENETMALESQYGGLDASEMVERVSLDDVEKFGEEAYKMKQADRVLNDSLSASIHNQNRRERFNNPMGFRPSRSEYSRGSPRAAAADAINTLRASSAEGVGSLETFVHTLWNKFESPKQLSEVYGFSPKEAKTVLVRAGYYGDLKQNRRTLRGLRGAIEGNEVTVDLNTRQGQAAFNVLKHYPEFRKNIRKVPPPKHYTELERLSALPSKKFDFKVLSVLKMPKDVFAKIYNGTHSQEKKFRNQVLDAF